jgi:hypothetical protein
VAVVPADAEGKEVGAAEVAEAVEAEEEMAFARSLEVVASMESLVTRGWTALLLARGMPHPGGSFPTCHPSSFQGVTKQGGLGGVVTTVTTR